MKTVHELKTLPDYFKAVFDREKTFEVRKNDRDFKLYDELLLLEFDPEKGFSGRSILVDVIYVLPGGQFGIEPGYCVLGIEKQDTGKFTFLG